MNNDSSFSIIGDEPVEARIVAWVLGEASAFEAEELERLCAERPELLVFKRRMRALHGLLTEAEAAQPDDGWKLPAEKRRALDEVFGAPQKADAEPVVERRVKRAGIRALLAIAACVMLTFGVLCFVPGGEYESEAVIEVKPMPSRGESVSLSGVEASQKEPMYPQHFATEFEAIKSRRQLEQVVDKLGLEGRWNVDRESAIQKLRNAIQVKAVRGTDLLSIRVKGNDAEETKQIAGEVTKSYQAYHKEKEDRVAEAEVAALNRAVRDQEDKVEERRKLLATITQTKGIIYKGQDSSYQDGIGVDEDRGAKAAVQEHEKLASDSLRLKTQVDSLQKYDGDQLMVYAAGLDQPDNIVRQVFPQYQDAQRQLETLKANGLADNHPAVRASAKKLETVKSQLDEGVVNLRSSLSAQLELTNNQLAEAEKHRNYAREDAIKRGLDAQDYVDAKRDYDSDQEMLKALKLKKLSADLSRNIPSHAVEIHDDPSTSTPVRKSVASSLLGKVSSLGGWFGDDGGGKFASRQAEAVASQSAPRTQPPVETKSLAARLPETRGMVVDRQESSDRGELAKNTESAPAKPAAMAPPAPVAPSAPSSDGSIALSYDSPGSNKFSKDVTSSLNGAIASVDGVMDEGVRTKWADVKTKRVEELAGRSYSNAEGKTVASGELDAPADRFGDMSGVSSLGSPNGGSGAGLGFGGLPSATGKTDSEALATGGVQVDKSLSDPVGLSGAVSGMKWANPGDGEKAPQETKPSEDVSKVSGRVPTQDELPAVAQLFKKENARATDENQPVDGKETEVSLTGEASDMPLPEMDGFVNFGRPIEERGRDGRAMVAPASRPGVEQSESKLVEREAVRRGVQGKVPAKAQAAESVLTEEKSGAVDGDLIRKNLSMAEGNVSLGRLDEATKKYEEVLRDDPQNKDARQGMEKLMDIKSQYFRAAYDQTRAELLNDSDKDWEFSIDEGNRDRGKRFPSEYEPPQIAQAPDLTKLTDEISAAEDPYSTFSLNVSDASFKIAQAALAKGERPDPASVKVEQFYNAVDYGDPAPSGAMPVALAAERCAHPVIPGRDLVRVSVKTAAAGRGASQPLRLTLLVDQSGSMVRADRREAMEKALSSLAGLLTANDRVTLIGFSRTPHLLADGMTGDQAGGLPGMVHQEAAEGGTNLEEAIKLAEQLAKRHKLAGAQNRIVLFTDGAANLGDANPASLAERVKTLRQAGFAFDIAGIAADDINDGLLAELARNGNGRYSIVGKGDDGQFAERLAGAFRPAAENVKVQVRFNPERVARYKLIGFEKDRLKTEDFRNDSVDAAEMAAEEAGVAVYQIETIPGGRGDLGEVSVRFRDAAAGGGMVERSIVLSHAGAAPAIDKATPSMQLAVLSVLAAEKLRGGPLAAAVDFSRLAGPRGSVRAHYGPGSRAAEMLQVIDRIQ